MLDIGCGTGTLLEEARATGHSGRLTGIDPAHGMIGLARRKPGIEWVCGMLEETEWQGSFDLAIMTGHAFQVLLYDEVITRFLGAVHRTLKPGGRFAFETRNPGARAWESWTPDKVKQVRVGGEVYEDRREIIRPYDGQHVTFTHTFTSPSWLDPRVSESTLNFPSFERVNTLLQSTGFSVDEQYGDWDTSPVNDTSPEIITIARKA